MLEAEIEAVRRGKFATLARLNAQALYHGDWPIEARKLNATFVKLSMLQVRTPDGAPDEGAYIAALAWRGRHLEEIERRDPALNSFMKAIDDIGTLELGRSLVLPAANKDGVLVILFLVHVGEEEARLSLAGHACLGEGFMC